jgi:hypothetical protein
MADRPRFTSLYTRKRCPVDRGLTGVTLVFQLLLFFQRHDGYCFLSHGIIGILIDYDKDMGRARGDAVAATIAPLCIDGDEVLTGTIFVSVIRKHSNTS